jgi:hypothetical protein
MRRVRCSEIREAGIKYYFGKLKIKGIFGELEIDGNILLN